jgi:hypothetical protein
MYTTYSPGVKSRDETQPLVGEQAIESSTNMRCIIGFHYMLYNDHACTAVLASRVEMKPRHLERYVLRSHAESTVHIGEDLLKK